jgi:hypothetical protein
MFTQSEYCQLPRAILLNGGEGDEGEILFGAPTTAQSSASQSAAMSAAFRTRAEPEVET